MAEKQEKKLVGIVMGSTSDWDIMKEAAKMCRDFGIPFETRALSAHRTPEELSNWIAKMEAQGAQAINPFQIHEGHGFASFHGTDAQRHPCFHLGNR